MLPRGTMWRLEATAPVALLLIEATNASYTLPEHGLVGPHAIFDPAMLDTPRIDDAFKAQQRRRASGRSRSSGAARISTVTYPFNPLDAIGWHGDLAPVRLNVRDIRPLMSHRYHLPPSAHTHLPVGALRRLHLRAAAVRDRPEGAQGAVLPQQRRLRRGDLLSHGRLLQPRQHPSRHDDASSRRLHPRPASQGADAHVRADQAGDRRVRGDDRHARRARCHGRRPRARVARLRRQLEGQDEARDAAQRPRDGRLVVVSRDLARALPVPAIAPTLQDALDDWASLAPRLQEAARALEQGAVAGEIAFDPAQALAPLPRAYHWVDGSAYVNHVELVRKARGAEMPPSFWTDPLVYQGGSDDFIAADRRRRGSERGLRHRPRGRDRRHHRRRADADARRRGGQAHQAAAAGQRLVAAQPDSRRTRQGLRLLPVEAGDRVLARAPSRRTSSATPGTTHASTCRWSRTSTASCSASPTPAST